MQIRPEHPADYAAIADIHIRAFGGRSEEATIAALLRQRDSYERELALVAEQAGQVVGHALFTPYTVQIGGVPVPAVCLAPIGVHPDYQRQGIGAALIEEGHRIARKQGYKMAFLLGHPTYYPRFGYRTHAFGSSTVTITEAHVNGMALPLTARPPQPQDVAALKAVWLAEEEDVDFVLEPECNLNDWLSPDPVQAARVYVQGDEIIGYTRGRANFPRVFWAKHEPAANDMAAFLLRVYRTLTLPLHPLSRSFRAFDRPQPPQVELWEAGMVNILDYDPLVAQYLADIQEGKRPAGRPIWPPAFDLA